MAKNKSKPKLTKRQERFLTLYNDLGGNVAATCDAMKICRKTFYNWRDDNDLFRENASDIKEAEKDWVESKLKANIRNEKEVSIFFYLKCQAPERGWVEKQQVSLEGEFSFMDILKEYSEETAVEPLDEITDND